MTLKDHDSSDELLVRAQAEAAAWMALLNSSERNAEIEAGLKRWIAADPLHARTWEVATDIWSETAGLPRRIPAAPRASRSSSRPTFMRPVVALAAVLCLAVVGATLMHFLLHPTVSTAVGEQRTLNLEDGTRVELNTDTHLVVKYDRQTRTVVLNSGEAYFRVAHQQRPFVVIAGQRKILALGTEFTVRHDQTADDPLTVTLIEGRVAVAPVNATNISTTPNDATAAQTSIATPDSEVKVLHPGERLRVRRHTPPTLDAPPMDKATGWMRGQLIFDHTPLRDAIAEFNRYSSAKINIASPEIGTLPVGGIFHISDSTSFARAVAETHNLRLIRSDNELILEQVDTAPSDPPAQ